MVSENGRMINIICIIIFFILSHLSPSPHPMPGVRQGGLSSGQTFTPGSVWRAEPWRAGRWRVADPSSRLLRHPQSLQEGIRLFSPGTGAGFLPFPKGGGGTWVCLTQTSPLRRGCKEGLGALFEV